MTTDISAVSLAMSDYDLYYKPGQFATEYSKIGIRISTSKFKVMTLSHLAISFRKRGEQLLRGEFSYLSIQQVHEHMKISQEVLKEDAVEEVIWASMLAPQHCLQLLICIKIRISI